MNPASVRRLGLPAVYAISEEITEKACSRALGAVCLLRATSAELLRVKRHKFPDAHRQLVDTDMPK
jgi:hypothetical protein